LIASFNCGCKKFVDINGPVTSINGGNVYKDDRTSIAVVNDIYSKISISNIFVGSEISSLSAVAGLSADEFDFTDGYNEVPLLEIYRNQLNGSSQVPANYWANCYNTIYKVNTALEGIGGSKTLSPAVKTQLLGELHFLRAFYYFYLVNLYGAIPLVTTSDYQSNAQLKRTDASVVYDQIISDLKLAQNTLSANYLDATLLKSTEDRVRPTKWAATALISRAYLYMQDYENALQASSILINEKDLFDTVSRQEVFKKNNSEAIWQLQPVNILYNTMDAQTFVIVQTDLNGPGKPVLSQSLFDSFEPNDQRKIDWIGTYSDTSVTPATIYHYPYKYKSYMQGEPVTEYATVFRLAEQYLIRSEARAKLGQLAEASADLNVIRRRAGLPGINYTTGNELLTAIQHERRVELFSEWGRRWFDLKRTGDIDRVMQEATKSKGGTWQTYQQLFPIPAHEIQVDKNLAQNTGY
jgi:hypothetical protein